MFKVGDIVFLKESSVYWIQSGGTEGEVVEGRTAYSHPYRVKWGNGQSNVYREEDLELVQPAKPKGISAFIKKWEKEYSNVKTA